MKKRVAFWVLNHECEEAVIRVGFVDIVKDLQIKFDKRNHIYLLLQLLNVQIPGKGISGGIGDAKNVLDLSIELGESLIPADLTRGQFLLRLSVH
jgi:hypothetical protein